ncbi:MAG: amidohydrolase family protein [Candidatus Bipolaricaulota bacterium]|nr:amidohydrolase family protein [Candidatus Bipolaricaulota bacterium]MDW8126773.1 hypothetical protein [Candidatus Bipolaricaulota bacterium]
MKLILSNVVLCTPWERVEKASVEIQYDRIYRISSGNTKAGEGLGGMLLAPGLIDTHMHGCAGIGVTYADVDELRELAKILPQYGVTAFVPTLLTAPHKDLLRACTVVAKAQRLQKENLNGARILGIHLEGPYLNPERSGAQNTRWLYLPNAREFQKYWRASKAPYAS